VLAAGAIAACGSSSSSSGNGIAGKSTSQILTSATNALENASSVHVSGAETDSGQTSKLDLQIVAGKGAKGTISQGGLSFQLIIVDKAVYIFGTQAFLQHFGGAAGAQLFKGKWLKAPSGSSDFSSLAALSNLRQLASGLLKAHGTLSKGSASTVSGQKVIALKDSTGGELFVATTGKPYPIEITKGGGSPQHVDFDHYDASVPLSPPAKSIDISKLQGK
jgi:hypothetical protein